MGVNGTFVKSFSDANLAVVTDISTNSDYPHFYFEVIGVADGQVKVRDTAGEESAYKIHGTSNTEYFMLAQSSTFERIYNKKPTTFKVCPFKGVRT